MFKRKTSDDDDPLLQLKAAQRLVIEEEEVEPLSEVTVREYLGFWWASRVTHRVTFAFQSILLAIVFSIGGTLILNFMFGKAYAEAGRDPTPTHTPTPPLPTNTRFPTVTLTKTPWPTPMPEGRGRALADIYTSSFDGYDNRFGTRLMGSKADFEEYLLCFNGYGFHRHLDGLEEPGYWGTWDNIEDEDGFCIPGIFYTVTKASDILITSDILHSIGLSEAEWLQVDTHIYANGPPPHYWVFCPMGVVEDTSKYCLGRQ